MVCSSERNAKRNGVGTRFLFLSKERGMKFLEIEDRLIPCPNTVHGRGGGQIFKFLDEARTKDGVGWTPRPRWHIERGRDL